MVPTSHSPLRLMSIPLVSKRVFTSYTLLKSPLPNIVPTFTSVSSPVYGRLGRIVTLSCTANETTAPVVWGIW